MALSDEKLYFFILIHFGDDACNATNTSCHSETGLFTSLLSPNLWKGVSTNLVSATKRIFFFFLLCWQPKAKAPFRCTKAKSFSSSKSTRETAGQECGGIPASRTALYPPPTSSVHCIISASSTHNTCPPSSARFFNYLLLAI